MLIRRTAEVAFAAIAKAIAPDCETRIVGVRPGEKIHELMISRDDARQTLELDTYYMIQPRFKFWTQRSLRDEGRTVPDDFEYNSSTNHWRLTVEEMKEIIKDL